MQIDNRGFVFIVVCVCLLLLGCRSNTQVQQISQPHKPQLSEQEAIARAIKERSADTFPVTPSKITGTISIPLPSGTRKFPATLQTQVSKVVENDFVVTLTEWWSSNDFPRVVMKADGTASEERPNPPETLTHTWKYEVTPEQIKLVDDTGDYPPDDAN